MLEACACRRIRQALVESLPFCLPGPRSCRLTPIFQLTPDNVRTLASTGGGCTSQFSSSSYNSAQDMKESVSARWDPETLQSLFMHPLCMCLCLCCKFLCGWTDFKHTKAEQTVGEQPARDEAFSDAWNAQRARRKP